MAQYKISCTAVCQKCGSTDFDFPADPKPDDYVVCNGCGDNSRYEDIIAEMKKKAFEHIMSNT